MNILILSPGYPYKGNDVFPFVKQLVDEWSRCGNTCVVVAPYAISSLLCFPPLKETIKYESGGQQIIIRPRYIRASSRGLLLKVTDFLKKNAYYRGIRANKIKPDFVYCHFWNMAEVAKKYTIKSRLPLFVASGESDIKRISNPVASDIASSIAGVICVSTKNRDESVSLGLAEINKCIVLPNSIDNSLFKKMNKNECRNILEIPHNIFIIVFVGWFIDRKGSLRVAEAINNIKDNDVYSIFIGSGKDVPNCSNILFKGQLPHSEIPLYLNSADVFVLPTKAEGCCNAVIEAMACGLPIISSNRPFNWDVLDNTNSILIEPENVAEITNAIITLRDDKQKRELLSKGAITRAKGLTIEQRASKIIEFVNIKKNELS